jgi:hypothetical protein
MDDINPTTEEQILPQYCYNVWETFAELRKTRNDLNMFAIIDSFVGVIQRGKQETHNLEILSTFTFLDKNRQELLNTKLWKEICQ